MITFENKDTGHTSRVAKDNDDWCVVHRDQHTQFLSGRTFSDRTEAIQAAKEVINFKD